METTRLNPWISIWTKPRKTMRQILEETGKQSIAFLLMMITGIVNVLDQAYINSMGDEMSLTAILLISLIGGCIIGLLYYYVSSGLLTWIGRKLGGTGSFKDIQFAVAYSSIPMVYSLVIVWIPSLLLFGIENFSTNMPNVFSSTMNYTIFNGLAWIDFAIGIWSIIIYLKCLGEAHQFSAWKALLAVLIPFMVLFVAIIALVTGLAFL